MRYSLFENVDLKRRITDVRRFSGYLLPYWDKQLVLFVCMGFSVLFGLAQPYFARIVIDYALLGGDLYIFNTLLLVGIVSYLFSVPIECIQKAAGFYLSTRVSLSLRSNFYKKMHLLSLRFAQSRSVGEHLYRLGADLDSVVQLIINTIPSALILFCRLTLLLIVCFWIDYKLTLLLLLISPFFYGHAWFFTNIQKRISSMMIIHTQGISSRLQQALAHMMLIKIFGKEKNEYSRFICDAISLIRLNIKNLRVGIIRSESGRLLNASITGAITYFLGYQVVKAQLTLGQLTAISMYLFQLNDAIRSVGGIYQDFVIKFIALDRAIETLDEKIEVKEVEYPVRTWKPAGCLELDHVSFAYRDGSPVLKNIRLKLRRGEKVLLTGTVGSGKTTVCHLILRLYDPLEGKITLNGHNIKDVKLNALRKAIGFAGSESMLFQDSVQNNICFGSLAKEIEDVVKVAKVVGIHDVIMGMPLGYDTVIESGADRLSSGQKQCICLARVLIKQPEVLILDEAFSSLDLKLVDQITTNINRLYPKMTTLIITHHIFDLKKVDRMVVLRNGVLYDASSMSAGDEAEGKRVIP